MFKRTTAPRRRKHSSAGSISVAPKPSRGNQRPAVRPPAAGFPDHRGRELRRSVGRIDVERGEEERLDEPLIERSLGR